MKKFAAFALIGGLAAFLLGYSPSDILYLWPSGGGSSNPPPKVRRGPAPAEQAQRAAPAQPAAASSVTTGSSNDGSLEHRWGPTKP